MCSPSDHDYHVADINYHKIVHDCELKEQEHGWWSPPISLTVTFSSISPTILLTATMLQPAQYFDDFARYFGHFAQSFDHVAQCFDHFAQYFDNFDQFDADLGHGDSIVNEDKTDDNWWVMMRQN